MFDEPEVEFDTFDVDQVNGTLAPEGTLFTPHESGPPKDPTKNIRFSVSLIKDYLSCGAKAWARITKQPGSKSWALVNGIAVHNALEVFAKHNGGADPMAHFKKSFAEESERNGLSMDSTDGRDKYTEGEAMVNTGKAILSEKDRAGIPFFQKVDPELVETFFSIDRNGRLFVGKIDLMHFVDDTTYTILDYKTSKTAPGQFELDTDLQFSLYHWATYQDPKLKTHGLWAARGVWLHLRGKNISGSRKKAEKVFQYSFPTKRTQEEVERDFTETVEPAAEAMERGYFPRVRGKQCTWCSYFDAAKNQCTVDLPTRTLIHASQGDYATYDDSQDGPPPAEAA